MAQTPLSEEGKQQLLRVLKGGLHSLPVPEAERETYSQTHSYFDYLKTTLGVDDPGVLHMARNSGLDWSNSGTELLTIAEAKECGRTGLCPSPVFDENNPYIHSLPGWQRRCGAGPRKKLIPKVAQGESAESACRRALRLPTARPTEKPSTHSVAQYAVDVHHAGDPSSSDQVNIKYIQNGQAHQVSAKNVVMACYNMMIPHIVSDLPRHQADALSQQMKSP